MTVLRLAVTRPLPDGDTTAAALRARGHDVLLAPLMQMQPLVPDFSPEPFTAVVITSANAVRAIAQHPRRATLLPLPVFAVGGHSADAARAAGFSQIGTADGDAASLVALIAAQRPQGTLLYLAGEHRSVDLAAALADHGIRSKLAVVYRMAALPFPARLARALDDALDGVLHFSRRSAALYLAGAASAGVVAGALAVPHYCLSAQVAEPFKTAGAAKIAVAPRPDEDAMIGLIA